MKSSSHVIKLLHFNLNVPNIILKIFELVIPSSVTAIVSRKMRQKRFLQNFWSRFVYIPIRRPTQRNALPTARTFQRTQMGQNDHWSQSLSLFRLSCNGIATQQDNEGLHMAGPWPSLADANVMSTGCHKVLFVSRRESCATRRSNGRISSSPFGSRLGHDLCSSGGLVAHFLYGERCILCANS